MRVGRLLKLQVLPLKPVASLYWLRQLAMRAVWLAAQGQSTPELTRGLLNQGGNFMASLSSNRVKRESSSQKDLLSSFFERHATTRKIVAYGPTAFFL